MKKKIYLFDKEIVFNSNVKIIGYDSCKNLIIYYNNEPKYIGFNRFLQFLTFEQIKDLKLHIYTNYYLRNLNIFEKSNNLSNENNSAMFNFDELPINLTDFVKN